MSVIEKKYGQWMPVADAMLDDPAAVSAIESIARRHLLDYCRKHHLTVVTEVETQTRRAWSFDLPRARGVALAECRAQGIPPEWRTPVGWRARLRAFLGAP